MKYNFIFTKASLSDSPWNKILTILLQTTFLEWEKRNRIVSFTFLIRPTQFFLFPSCIFYFIFFYSFYSFARKAVADRQRCGARHRGGWSRIRTTSLSVYLTPPPFPPDLIFCLTLFLPLVASFLQPRTLSFFRTCPSLTTHSDWVFRKIIVIFLLRTFSKFRFFSKKY